MKVIPYDKAHMDLFEQKASDKELYGEVNSETGNPIAEYGVSFTAIEDGRILIMGGILPTSERTGKCWTMVSDYAANYGHRIFRLVKNQLKNMMEDMDLHRLETANIKEATEHNRWCKLLGFKQEGEMSMYDDKGRTYIRLAKIREG